MHERKFLSLLIFIFLIPSLAVKSQDTLRVLFLGNSYTSVNNLPQLVKNIATSNGTAMVVDQNVPGGYSTENHLTNAASLNKIRAGVWNFVVIQEQSQIPTIDYYRYNSMYPSMLRLKDSILTYNPCAKIITYMTWGRRFGGQQCDGTNTYCSPAFRDFNHMQDSLKSAYMQISDSMNVICSPVGISWQQVLNDTSLVLHQTDNSHPNLYGSYLAACSIYSCMLKKYCGGISYTAGLSAPLAIYLQSMSDLTVFSDNNDWNLNIYQPQANFSTSINVRTASFSNASQSLSQTPLYYRWDFGDGDSSFLAEPTHTYAEVGSYQVRLIAKGCHDADTLVQTLVIAPSGNSGTNFYSIYPNPARDKFFVSWNTSEQPLHICIYNSVGQKMIEQSFDVNSRQVNTEKLSQGFYFIKISGATHTETIRLNILR